MPLVLCLIGLSAYPNLISGHAFGGGSAVIAKGTGTVTLASMVCRADNTSKSEQMCASVLRPAGTTTLSIDRESVFAAHPVAWVRYAP